MNQESPYTDIQSRLSRIEEKVNKIDRTINPPFWLKLLRWIGRNFFTLVLLIIVLFLAYKGWEMYQNVLSSIDEIKSMPANAIDSGKDVLEDVVDKLRFW
jgi:tetrahydromethanopterin S-methyltransferase subunit G